MNNRGPAVRTAPATAAAPVGTGQDIVVHSCKHQHHQQDDNHVVFYGNT